MLYRTLALTMLILFIFPTWVAAQPATQEIEGGTIVASGFNGPQGIAMDAEGNLWVIESGLGGDEAIQYISMETGKPTPTKMGTTARIVMVSPNGEQTEVAALPSLAASPMEMVGGARLTWLDGALYATSGVWMGGVGDAPDRMGTVVRVENGEVTEVADLWAYEEANNLDGLILESHPYGITAGPDGWLWMADAGANTLMRINPESGEIESVVTFDGLPGPFPNPARNDAMEADPVPTAVVFDDAGNAYVSLLSGFPFAPESGKVVFVTPDGAISDYATGLTMLTDLQRGPDGALYAVQFGMFAEQGPVPNAGSIVRIQEGNASEVLVSGLPFPTGLAFDQDGNAFATINGLGAPGSGAVVRFDDLINKQGEPVQARE
jgi:sugar lactone lactonase YvrE